jgi:hypothetical protein
MSKYLITVERTLVFSKTWEINVQDEDEAESQTHTLMENYSTADLARYCNVDSDETQTIGIEDQDESPKEN